MGTTESTGHHQKADNAFALIEGHPFQFAEIPQSKEDIMEKVLLVSATALAAVFLFSQTNGSDAKKSQLDGTWELVSGQPLPKGARDIKIISGEHFIFVAYDMETGKPLYTGGGTYTLNGGSYTEHIDFASEEIAAGLVGKDQPFTVKLDGDTFTQKGTRSNGKYLSETWKRVN
jgi:hypothetical protein